MAAHAANTPSGRRLSFRGLTFSIRQLLLGTAFVALACLALRGASAWWVSAMFSLAVTVLAIGVLLAVYRTAGERAFWTGFAFCGAVHMALVLYGWHVTSSQNVSSGHPLKASRNNHKLLTARISVWAHDWFFTPRTPRAPQTDVTGFSTGGYGDYVGGMAHDPMGDAPAVGMPGGYGGYSGDDGGYGAGGMSGSADGGYGGGYGVPGGGGIPGGYPVISDTPGLSSSVGPPPTPRRQPPALADFVNVGHSLWTLLLAAAGGWIALVIYSSGPRRDLQETMP